MAFVFLEFIIQLGSGMSIHETAGASPGCVMLAFGVENLGRDPQAELPGWMSEWAGPPAEERKQNNVLPGAAATGPMSGKPRNEWGPGGVWLRTKGLLSTASGPAPGGPRGASSGVDAWCTELLTMFERREGEHHLWGRLTGCSAEWGGMGKVRLGCSLGRLLQGLRGDSCQRH